MMTIKSINDTTVLNNEVEMPWLGFGVFQIPEGEEVEQSVRWALETGYRSIDTAAAYGNEAGVGKAIRESGIPREEIFVTTKVWNSDQGYDNTLAAFDTSLQELAMSYVDLYLVHWPVEGKYKETWRALEEIYQSGRARAIGVSNFLTHHLKELLQDSGTVPAVNQVEFHPYLQQPDLQAFCRENRIQLEAWSPLIKGQVVDVPELVELGEKYGKSPAQVTLRWMLQHRVVTIPKSVHKNRIQENADIFDFELETEDMAVIDGLDRHHRTGPDPDDFDL
jgi:diketogulonate reductase-like aldo/keto reductase